VHCQVI